MSFFSERNLELRESSYSRELFHRLYATKQNGGYVYLLFNFRR